MAAKSFDTNDKPRRHPDASYRQIGDDGGLVVLPGRAEVKVLNPVGVRIFSLLDGEKTVAEIASEVAAEFDVAADVALGDARDFLTDLSAHGMLAE